MERKVDIFLIFVFKASTGSKSSFLSASFQPNWQEGPDTICNCCCCHLFQAVHKLGQAQGFRSSNYIVRTNSETCIGCGPCVRHCHMGALSLQERPDIKRQDNQGGDKEMKNKAGKASVLNADRSIGCGVCSYKCPAGSLVLEQREVIFEPPKTASELAGCLNEDFAAGIVQT